MDLVIFLGYECQLFDYPETTPSPTLSADPAPLVVYPKLHIVLQLAPSNKVVLKISHFPSVNILFLLTRTISKFWVVGLQVLAYAQQSRECSDYEQVSLIERMEEYLKQIDRESRQSLNSSFGSPMGDSVRPFSRNSNKVIEAAMQSAVKGKVFSDVIFTFSGSTPVKFSNFTYLSQDYNISGSNHSTRISLKTILKFER